MVYTAYLEKQKLVNLLLPFKLLILFAWYSLLNLNTNKTSVLYLSTEMNPSETISRINFMKCNLEENKFLYTFQKTI